MRHLYILGFPGLYGGANSELHHQILLWAKAFKEIKLHIIPTMNGFANEPLYNDMINLGIDIHGTMDFSMLTKDDAIINFCSKEYLENLDEINKLTKRTMWVNCMTWIFDQEKIESAKNNINFSLYQRPQIKDLHERELKKLGSRGQFDVFKPYFHSENFPYRYKESDTLGIGRISRADPAKYSKDIVHIYEYITSPKWKKGVFLGFNEKIKEKIGNVHSWIKTYNNHHQYSVDSFYSDVDIIVQPTDTNENWPRIGFEAMYSGKPLVVNNRGGWKYMIEHGVSGFLCKDTREFIYWGTRLAFEPELRERISVQARERAQLLSSFEESKESWKQIFDKVYA